MRTAMNNRNALMTTRRPRLAAMTDTNGQPVSFWTEYMNAVGNATGGDLVIAPSASTAAAAAGDQTQSTQLSPDTAAQVNAAVSNFFTIPAWVWLGGAAVLYLVLRKELK